MIKHIRINFSEDADLGLAEYLLDNAVVAVCAITSEEALKQHAGVRFSAENRAIELKVRGPAGEALRRCLLALIDLHMDEAKYEVAKSEGEPKRQLVAVIVAVA